MKSLKLYIIENLLNEAGHGSLYNIINNDRREIWPNQKLEIIYKDNIVIQLCKDLGINPRKKNINLIIDNKTNEIFWKDKYGKLNLYKTTFDRKCKYKDLLKEIKTIYKEHLEEFRKLGFEINERTIK